MTKTIQTALAPLLIIGSFCSLSLFEYPLGKPRPYLTYLYILTTWILFMCFYYYLAYNGSISNIWYLTYDGVAIIIAITSMLVSLFYFKELKMCMHKLSIVDDTLEALGTPKEYQRLRNWIIRIIIGWIVLSLIIMDALEIFLSSYDNFNIATICAPFLEYHFYNVNNLSSFIWAAMLRCTSSRFQRVNERIAILYSDLLEDNADYTRRQNQLISVNQQKTKAKRRMQYMWILMHVHLQLSLISRKLNKIFNLQMSLQMSCYFVCILEVCREIYLLDIEKNAGKISLETILGLHIDFVVYSVIIVILNHVCQTVYYKVDETVGILYKLFNCNLDEDFRNQILQFILQIKQREVKFGMGLLYLGYSFILQFYEKIATILVIMIQMGYTYWD